MPDVVVAEAGRPLRIDVLANDIGLSGPERQSLTVQVEGAPQCGSAEVDGRAIVYTGQAACVGTDIRFGYGVQVGETTVTSFVVVTVKPQGSPQAEPGPQIAAPQPSQVPRVPSSGACDMPGLDWAAVSIPGGSFSRADAPPEIVDLVELVAEPQFSVQPFCMTVEAAPADVVDPYFNQLGVQARQEQFPEMQNPANVSVGRQDPVSRMAARASQNMARSFAEWASARSGRQLSLPTLEEYVAAAWSLQAAQRTNPQADVFLVTLRSGNLQWTRSTCGSSDSFWLIGPGAQGRLVKLCYHQSRLDRTGFRLSIK